MKRSSYRPGQGMYVYLTMTDQFNSKDVIFRDSAPAENPKKIFQLLQRAQEKGMKIDFEDLSEAEKNRRFLFDND